MIVILIESAALYAVTFLIYIGSWASGGYTVPLAFFSVISQAQVGATSAFPRNPGVLSDSWSRIGHCPFLVTLRVSERRALKNETVTFGPIGSIRFKGQIEFGRRWGGTS